MKKRRRLPEPPLNGYGEKNKRKRPPRRNGKSRSSAGSGDMTLGVGWRGRELGSKKSTTVNAGPLEPVLTLSLTPWDGANMSGPGKGHLRVPHGLGTLWSASPMDHQQLAVRMVCSWGPG